ncbi:MAG: nitroreductase [Lentisphaerae bacterium RIFOXYC12_FULL_60_16]|nr:MAG: nitroreductase [Lentisphaerae bacterium RIFOXYC12_FULL_60_16]OGV73393.1 MAG: nitroreductase [Lentisphaerae bacterium RIFOXYA12_FULL_60_10]OGV77511.1 MAG: nitroreductase [Lentisphaerae bacterium RIFOXYB12_FULL_60_10]
MTFLELVRQRRSVRDYRPDPVPRPLLEQCLEAARLAPSACNSQPWRFIVVDDPSLRTRVAEAAFGGIYTMNRFAAAAPVLVVVARENSRYAARLGGLLRGVQFGLLDIGIAVDHFTLQAAELGIGTCWLGWFNARAVCRALNLPRSTRLDAMLSVGYPTTPADRVSGRKPPAEIWSFNRD